jgi:hypothetical protein
LLLVWIILVGTFLSLFAAIGAKQFAAYRHHNRILRECMEQDIEIVVQRNPELHRRTAPQKTKSVTITDPKRKIWLLKRFLIYWAPLGEAFHGCSGQLTIIVKTPTHTYYLPYDHGCGTYPISDRSHRSGFVDLNESVCMELNNFFRSIGFSNEDLGISDLSDL